MKLATTVERIAGCASSTEGWVSEIDAKPDDKLDLLFILERHGLNKALWALRAAYPDPRRAAAILCIEFAEQSLPIYEAKRERDAERAHLLIDASRSFMRGQITHESIKEAKRHAHCMVAGAVSAGFAATAAAEAIVCAVRAAQLTHGIYLQCIEQASATVADTTVLAANYAAEAVAAVQEPAVVEGKAGIEIVKATHETGAFIAARAVQGQIVRDLLAS